MRVLCIARHSYLAEHLSAFFRGLDCETRPCVGLADAPAEARDFRPVIVVCDYDLLATHSLDEWERDPVLSGLAVLAVSLTRRPNEVHVLDVNGIAGFLYLPTLDREDALRLIAAAARPRRAIASPPSLPWPGQSQAAQIR